MSSVPWSYEFFLKKSLNSIAIKRIILCFEILYFAESICTLEMTVGQMGGDNYCERFTVTSEVVCINACQNKQTCLHVTVRHVDMATMECSLYDTLEINQQADINTNLYTKHVQVISFIVIIISN